jgi:hypothetical protein
MINLEDIDKSLKQDGIDPESGRMIDQAEIPVAAPIKQKYSVKNSIDKILSNPATQGVLGAGDAVANQMRDILSLIPGVKLQNIVLGNKSDMAYQGGQIAGNLAGYLGLGSLGGAGLEAAEAIPAIGKIAGAIRGGKGLMGGLRRGMGNIAYGATMNPDDRAKGAIEGGALSAAGEALPVLAKGIGKIADSINPSSIVNAIHDFINPSKIDEVTQSGKKLYKNIFSKFSKRSIYDNTEPVDFSASGMDDGKGIVKFYGEPAEGAKFDDAYKGLSYTDLPEDQIKNVYNSDLKALHRKFINNPTIENAHELQSQLGTELRAYNAKEVKNIRLDAADRNIRDSYKLSQSMIQNDIKSFLYKENPNLVNDYNNANYNWAKKVIPLQNANHIISKVGENAAPEKINSAILKAQDRNIRLPEEFDGFQTNLEKTIARKNIAQKAAGAVLGASLGHSLGGAGEIGGALLGSYIGAPLMKSIGIPSISSATKGMGSKAYDILRSTYLSNKLLGENQ